MQPLVRSRFWYTPSYRVQPVCGDSPQMQLHVYSALLKTLCCLEHPSGILTCPPLDNKLSLSLSSS